MNPTTNPTIRHEKTGRKPRSLTYEILELDGGWLTRDGIVAASGTNPEGVRTALARMVKAGWVEKRVRVTIPPLKIWEFRAISEDEL